MTEGRDELQTALDVWERRHAAALMAKREAEVVMPFLRAALEELESFQAGKAEAPTAPAATAPRAQTVPPAPVRPAVAPVAEAAKPSPFDGDFSFGNDEEEEPAAAAAPAEFPSRGRRGIAELMDEDEAAAG